MARGPINKIAAITGETGAQVAFYSNFPDGMVPANLGWNLGKIEAGINDRLENGQYVMIDFFGIDSNGEGKGHSVVINGINGEGNYTFIDPWNNGMGAKDFDTLFNTGFAWNGWSDCITWNVYWIY